jgi:hypothetical protein
MIECCMPFSDYVVYVDESGDHSLQSIDPNFPVFSLVFCIFKKSDFIEAVVPIVQRLKFDFWGHDAVVLRGMKSGSNTAISTSCARPKFARPSLIN